MNEEAKEKFAAFGRWCLSQHRECFGDLGGDELQDKAIELGLLHEVRVTEPCTEGCSCAEYYGSFPCDCLREVYPEEGEQSELDKAIEISKDPEMQDGFSDNSDR